MPGRGRERPPSVGRIGGQSLERVDRGLDMARQVYDIVPSEANAAREELAPRSTTDHHLSVDLRIICIKCGHTPKHRGSMDLTVDGFRCAAHQACWLRRYGIHSMRKMPKYRRAQWEAERETY